MWRVKNANDERQKFCQTCLKVRERIRYNPSKDTIQVASSSCWWECQNKKKYLVSNFWHICYLYIYLSQLKGEYLLPSYSTRKWNRTVISTETQHAWSSIAKDFIKVSPDVLWMKHPEDLHIFCDASKRASGSVAYIVQNGRSALVFAKAKVSPLKSKTLPNLELHVLFLAIKCLWNILEMFSNISIKNTFVAVDTQTVLSLLLSEGVKAKNWFVKNRIKDISKTAKESVEKYSKPHNPADFINRGIAFKKFQRNFNF